MTTQAPTPDLFKYWKDLYDQFEKTWTQPMHQMLSSESFVAGMGATRDSYLTSQKTLREGMEQYLKSLHVPTKTDFTNLASLVISLESKVEAVEDRLEHVEEHVDGRFDALNAKIDALTAQVDGLTAQIAKLAALPVAPTVEVVVPSAEEAPAAVASAKRRATK